MDELANYGILLSGGTGTRMGNTINRPKQYIEVNNKPIIIYSLLKFEQCKDIKGVVIVVSSKWLSFCKKMIEKYNITKVIGFAESGETRQNSVFSGLLKLRELVEEAEYVVIHDAARPQVSEKLISRCIIANRNCDGVIPCIPMKDTIYESKDGKHIDSLLIRNHLRAGQAPECFCFKKYLDLHLQYTSEELKQFSGSTEIAIKHHLNICIIDGEESNYKITTMEDLNRFKEEVCSAGELVK